jgi:UDP-N-acetylmuramoyl-tripeptide--D-alanyl-D-alanine ligase
LADALTDAIVPAGKEFGSVKFNSQHIVAGDLFIALPGNRDGHEFVHDALSRGAGGVIIAKKIEGLSQDQYILVQDCYQALLAMARYKRKISKAKIIAITGSVGKTTTKELARLMLSDYGKTVVSEGTFNNYLGVPLTLSSLPNDAEYVVVEIGMNHQGELRELTNLTLPHVALLTTVAEGHIEFFKSIEEIADAKCEIFEGLTNDAAIAILNRDMSMYERCLGHIKALGLKNIYDFGSHNAAYGRFIGHDIMPDGKMQLHYTIAEQNVTVGLDHIPLHFTSNIAAILTIIEVIGLDFAPALERLADFQVLMGRGRLVHTQNERKKYNIICDYYNSNPESLRASLSYLQQFNGNKVAILGDMRELGEFSEALHEAMIPHIIQSGAKKLLLVGEQMSRLKEKFSKSDGIQILTFTDAAQLQEVVNDLLSDEDTILIKASRGIMLDKIVTKMGVKDAF